MMTHKQNSTARKTIVMCPEEGGCIMMLLWFCPIHGHNHGFHIISGAEDRKDPFTSGFLYMDMAPDEVLYDFSCQLQEYCLTCSVQCTYFRCRLRHAKCVCVFEVLTAYVLPWAER